MTGSMRYFGYTTDSGQERYVHLDESNSEIAALGLSTSIPNGVFADERNALRATAKRPLQMRYVLAQRQDADDRTVTRKFWVGSTSALIWQANQNNFSDGTNTWYVTAKIGEQRYLPAPSDTGLIDGDAESNVAAGP